MRPKLEIEKNILKRKIAQDLLALFCFTSLSKCSKLKFFAYSSYISTSNMTPRNKDTYLAKLSNRVAYRVPKGQDNGEYFCC